MTQHLTLKGSASRLSRLDISEGISEARFIIKHYTGISLYSLSESPDYPVWAIMEGDSSVYCLEPTDWPEEGAMIEGIVIVNPAI